jgi:diguanylate cyclase (GGDEF)-like protein
MTVSPWVQKANAYFERASLPLLYLLALLGIMVTAGLDDLSGVELSFSIFYLAPVLFMAWYGGFRHGSVCAALAGVVWLVIELLAGKVYTHYWIGIWNASVRFGFFLLSAYLLNYVHALLKLQRSLAETDGLTHLKNSRAFYAALRQEADRAVRYRRPLTIAYLDLDNFKQVNDGWGHETGDKVLRIVADLLRGHLRMSDVTARMGGDEFVLLLPEVGPEAARQALEKVRSVLLTEMVREGWPVTASIGAVTFLEVAGDVSALIHAADELMYEVKRQGKNAIRHLCLPVAIPPEIG